MATSFSTSKVFDTIKACWESIQKDIINYALMIFVGVLVQGVSLGILAGPVTLGMYKGALKLKRGEKVAVGDAFSGMNKFGPTFMLILLIGLCLTLVAAVIMGINGLLAFLAITLGDSVSALGVLITIVNVLLSIGLWLAYAVLSIAVCVAASLAFVLIAAEDLGMTAALKKSIAWIKAERIAALEYLFGLFLCSLGSVIPLVGSLAAIGFSNLYTWELYTAEKEAGHL